MSRPLWIAALPFFALLLSASQARAQDDFFEPQSLAMGGAVRVLGGDASSIHLNPASMVVRPRYIAGMSYLFEGREKSHIVASGAYDSRTSAFSLGTKYTVWNFSPPFDAEQDLNWFPVEDTEGLEDKRTWQRWDIAAAYGFVGRRINVGLTARILQQEFDLREKRTFFTMDGGVSFFPHPRFGFGFSVQNFIPTKDNRFPTRLSPGLGLLIDDFLQLEADAVFTMLNNQEQPDADLHIGADLTLFRTISIRAGFYSERQFTETYVTWGLGLKIQRAKLKLHYAMRVEVGEMDRVLREGIPEHRNRLVHGLGFDVNM